MAARKEEENAMIIGDKADGYEIENADHIEWGKKVDDFVAYLRVNRIGVSYVNRRCSELGSPGGEHPCDKDHEVGLPIAE